MTLDSSDSYDVRLDDATDPSIHLFSFRFRDNLHGEGEEGVPLLARARINFRGRAGRKA